MASLPLALAYPQQESRAATPYSPIVGSVPPVRLSALEWSIVAMAEQDGMASIREPGRFIVALESLFGVKRPNRLANPRLEALRRLAILAWHHRWNVPKSEVQSFIDAGFTFDQYELIQNSIGKVRPTRRRRTVR